MSRFSEELIEDKNVFRVCIMEILAKLNDVDSVSVAEREMKSFIVNQVNDGERLNVLIGCIAEHNQFQALHVKIYQIKLLIIIAEVFQHQILEYFPRIFKYMNTRLLKEKEHEIFTAIGNTYAGLLENSLRNTNQSDSTFVLEEAFKSLFEILMESNESAQMGVGIVLARIIQITPSRYFKDMFDFLLENIINYLRKDRDCNSPFEMLECLLSLCLVNRELVDSTLDEVLPTLLKFFSHRDPKVKKIAIDNIYSLTVTCQESIQDYAEELISVIGELKRDKNTIVRKAAIAALSALKELSPKDNSEISDAQQHSMISSSKFNNSRGTISTITQKESFGTRSAVIEKKKPLIGGAQVVDAKKTTKAKIQYGINKNKINPAFKKQVSNDIEIFVNDKQKVFSPTENVVIDGRPKVEKINVTADFPQDKPAVKIGIVDDKTVKIVDNDQDIEIYNSKKQEEPPSEYSTFKSSPKPTLIYDSNFPVTTKIEFEDMNLPNEQVSNMDERDTFGLIPPQKQSPKPVLIVDKHEPRPKDRRFDFLDSPGVGRISEPPNFTQPRQSSSSKITTKDYSTEEYRALVKQIEVLKAQGSADHKKLKSQDLKIEALSTHVHTLTNHLNALLSKVSMLESGMYNISNQRMFMPQQMMMGGGISQFPAYQQQQIMGQQFMYPHQAQHPQEVVKSSKKKKNKWKKRKHQDKEPSMTFEPKIHQKRNDNDEKKQQAKSQSGDDEESESRSKDDMRFKDDITDIALAKISKSDLKPKEFENPNDRVSSERSVSETDSPTSKVDINDIATEVLRSRDSHLLRSFLIDPLLLERFDELKEINSIKLLAHITDCLMAEDSQITSISLNWIEKFILEEKIGSKTEARALNSALSCALKGVSLEEKENSRAVELTRNLREFIDKTV